MFWHIFRLDLVYLLEEEMATMVATRNNH